MPLVEVLAKTTKLSKRESEEVLNAFVDVVTKELKKGGPVGKKLDFIAQEMNREANTTLSKSSDLTVADNAILLKTTIEKIREQIQNIE